MLDIVIAAEAEVVDSTKSDAQIGIRYDATSQSELAPEVIVFSQSGRWTASESSREPKPCTLNHDL